jgi:hypothetical protein
MLFGHGRLFGRAANPLNLNAASDDPRKETWPPKRPQEVGVASRSRS